MDSTNTGLHLPHGGQLFNLLLTILDLYSSVNCLIVFFSCSCMSMLQATSSIVCNFLFPTYHQGFFYFLSSFLVLFFSLYTPHPLMFALRAQLVLLPFLHYLFMCSETPLDVIYPYTNKIDSLMMNLILRTSSSPVDEEKKIKYQLDRDRPQGAVSLEFRF